MYRVYNAVTSHTLHFYLFTCYTVVYYTTLSSLLWLSINLMPSPGVPGVVLPKITTASSLLRRSIMSYATRAVGAKYTPEYRLYIGT